MTRHASMRKALAESIIAALPAAWNTGNVLHKRTTSLWNDMATATAAAKDGYVLHIGVTAGEAIETGELNMDLDVPLTIVRSPSVAEEEEPLEEKLWEDLVRHVNRLVLEGDQWNWRFRFASFQDIEIEADDGTAYFGRQTIFKKELSL